MKLLLLVTLFISFSCASSSKKVDYQIDGKEFQGYLAIPKDDGVKKPVVIVIHEWWGQNDYARMRADMLAKEGYVAFALDMYGEGQTTDNPKKAGELAGSVYGNLPQARKRFQAALSYVKSLAQVDTDKVAAIGYCFGGGLVLHMARSGMDLDGVISYHGTLKPFTKPAKKGQIKGEVLAFNGAADPMVPKAEVVAFNKEMRAAKVKYRSVDYAGALHAFTNPGASEVGKKWNLPVAYDEKADKDSWAQSLSFLKKVLR